MGDERGQATVEWTGLLLLVALALVALGHAASTADGQELGATLAHAVTHPRQRAPQLARPRLEPVSRPVGRMEQGLAVDLLRRAGRGSARGAGALWRRAWFACLVYERIRYAMRHPESRRPDYTFPYDVALRIVNGCAVPVDLLRDLPTLDPSP